MSAHLATVMLHKSLLVIYNTTDELVCLFKYCKLICTAVLFACAGVSTGAGFMTIHRCLIYLIVFRLLNVSECSLPIPFCGKSERYSVKKWM